MIRHLCFVPLLAVAVLSMASGVAAQIVDDKAPDPQELARAANVSAERLRKEAASWISVTQVANGTTVSAKCLSTPGMRRIVVGVEVQGQKAGEFRVIERDGLWYVTDGRRNGKYRPYEAPLGMPAAYFFLGRAELRFSLAVDEAGAYEGSEDGVATFRSPLTETMRKQIQFTITELEKVAKQKPGLAGNPESVKVAERLRQMLPGVPVKIEIASGILSQFGTADRQTEIHEFQWLQQVAAEEFSIKGQEWEDYSEDPTKGDTSELIMIGHAEAWRPGMKSVDTEARLMNARTGRFRRIPFQGIGMLPGCFLKDRSRVVISGIDGVSAAMGLYEINLQSGENRRLGGDRLATGQALMPALSPDGKRIAVLHKQAEGRPLDSQICLVDLATGEAEPVGEPDDIAFLSWLPDGQGLLMLRRESPDPSDLRSPRTDTVVLMGLDGRATKILDGGAPVLLNDGKTILFRDSKDLRWQTCDLDGTHVQQYADGLLGYMFPSPAPDGKRILMMHFTKGAAPEPTILELGESRGKPITKAPGLWALPAWR